MTELLELNEAQTAALDLDRNVAVLAVAGSGKTTVLVNRYIRILENESAVDPSGILAITFNESAAAHLRAKIREKLYERDTDARWRDACRALTEAPISTIHGFCARVLREHPLEASVDPDFAVLDPVDAAILLTDAVRETFDRAKSGTDIHAAILTLTSNLTRRPDRHIENLISRRDVLAPVVEKFSAMSIEELVESSRSKHLDAVADVARQVKNSELIDGLREMAELAGDASGDARDTLNTIDRLHKDLERDIDEPGELEGPFDVMATVFLSKNRKNARKRAPGKKAEWKSINSYERYTKELFPTVAQTVLSTGLGELTSFRQSRECVYAETVHALLNVYRACLVTYADMKRARRTLDFCDLQQLCVDLLETHPDIRGHLATRYAHIMVDEFQDTNSLQWRVIRNLAKDDDGKLRSKGLFVVGDEAQSIYGFRNAEIEVFREVRQDIRHLHGTKDIESTENFRSAPDVVDAVNAMFGKKQNYLDLKAFRREFSGAVEIVCAGSGDEDVSAAAKCVEEARLVAARIVAAVEPGDMEIVVDRADANIERARFGDVTVLLRTRTHMAGVFDVFKSAGIPYYAASGVGYFQQQEVWDILTALRCIAVPDDEISLAGYLRSPLAAISDETLLDVSFASRGSFRDKIREYDGHAAKLVTDAVDRLDIWRKYAGRATIQGLIRTICDDTGVWTSLASSSRGPHPAENVERLIDMARTFSSTESRDVRAFLERMDFLVESDWLQGEAPADGGAMNAVRVMTVHESKGLEFPIVFVMQCHRKYNFGDRDLIKEHKKEGFGFKVPDPENGYERSPTSRYGAVRKATREECRQEELRLLHVACTRARDALVFSGYGDPKSDSWWSHVLETLPRDSGIATYRDSDELTYVKKTATDTAPHLFDELVKIAEGPIPKVDDVTPDARRIVDGLERVTAVARPIEMSPTQWMTYEECPRRYFYRYLLGAEEPVTGDMPISMCRQGDEVHADALTFGSLVHRALELFIRNRDIGDAVDQSLAEMAMPEPELGEQMAEIVREFAESATGRAACAGREQRAEQDFTIKAAGAVIRGSIDLLWQGDDGRWHVVDYKTSRSESHTCEGTARRKHLAERYAPQLALYALATRRFTESSAPVECTLYLTDAPDEPHQYVPFGEQEEQQLVDRLDEATTVIASEPVRMSDFAPAPDIHGIQTGTSICRECGFHHAGICEACP